MKTLFLLLLLCLLANFAWSRDHDNYVIRDKNYVTQGYVKDGKIFDRDYRIKGYIDHSGVVRDRDYKTKGYIDKNGGDGRKRGNK